MEELIHIQFDQFYNVAYQLLDAFYPECTITVTIVAIRLT